MLNQTHLMLDLETLGLSANGAIVQIGACYFDPKSGKVGETFERHLWLEDVVNHGFEVEPDTLLWWLKQSEAARTQVFNNSDIKVTTRDAIYDLTVFMGNAEVVWSHLTLDAMLIAEYQRRLKIAPRVPYYAHQDLRTLKNLAQINTADFPPTGEAHVALDDCKFQVQYCVEALKRLLR